VADANRTVYVYTAAGALLGSWAAGGLHAQAQVEGLATDGTDVWLLDNRSDRVYRYAGAAGRRSGSQSPAGSFALVGGKTGNTNGKGIVTDGASFWVVNDGPTQDKGAWDAVFKYTLAGAPLGSWTIDRANASPTGLTIDPTNVSDIWIVDNGTDRVYQYVGAAGRTAGFQTAATWFALAAGNTDPQDIADPPTPGDRIELGRAAPPGPAVIANGRPTAGRVEGIGAVSAKRATPLPAAADRIDWLMAAAARRRKSLLADWLAD
jgi:hypothetical protein